mmetsp:Transcript_28583/g.61270  ORF Transcript_28583/g.61270 Transcript_28583/m.61270 type:complete len:84 (+) Transcript_28583:994-1245(+)
MVMVSKNSVERIYDNYCQKMYHNKHRPGINHCQKLSTGKPHPLHRIRICSKQDDYKTMLSNIWSLQTKISCDLDLLVTRYDQA